MWLPMRVDSTCSAPKVIFQTFGAIVVAALVSLISNVPIAASVVIMLASWPIADIVIERIESRNHLYGNRTERRLWWVPIVTITIWFALGASIHLIAKIPFPTALAYSILGASVGGAILRTAVAAEDAQHSRNETTPRVNPPGGEA